MAKINTKILRIETSVARPVELQIFRGENVPVELHFANYGNGIDLTGCSVEAYYQSLDMGDSWYKDETAGHLVIDESGEYVTWLWTPDIDAGADKYRWFVRVFKTGEEDDSYRAFGTIEMLASPAHNQVQPFPPPPTPIDCSKYEWLNAPWYTKEETDEAIADAISEIPAPDYPVTSVNGKTGAVVLSPSDVGAATAEQGAKADRAVLYRTDVTTAVDIGTRKSGTTVGAYSTVEGGDATASATYSHAEGSSSSATGYASHAESAGTASGPYSHAEGAGTTAAGYYTHAEGSNTTASGSHAHSEGENTSATGYASHAEGFYTEARNHSEHAQGEYNLSHTGNTDAGKTIHSIGVGATIFARSNAVEVMRDGKVFIKGVGSYDGTNPTASGVKDLATEIGSKQDTLTFDNAPTANSSNPVTSAGIKTAITVNDSFSEWDFTATPSTGISNISAFYSEVESCWIVSATLTIDGQSISAAVPTNVYDPNALSLTATFSGQETWVVSGTRELESRIIGNQTSKPLQPAGDYALKSDIPTPPVTSVNSKTGAVVLTASDVGALPDSYTAPVTSVNGKTGVVTLTASDVGAAPAGNYALLSDIPEVVAPTSEATTGQAADAEATWTSLSGLDEDITETRIQMALADGAFALPQTVVEFFGTVAEPNGEIVLLDLSGDVGYSELKTAIDEVDAYVPATYRRVRRITFGSDVADLHIGPSYEYTYSGTTTPVFQVTDDEQTILDKQDYLYARFGICVSIELPTNLKSFGFDLGGSILDYTYQYGNTSIADYEIKPQIGLQARALFSQSVAPFGFSGWLGCKRIVYPYSTDFCPAPHFIDNCASLEVLDFRNVAEFYRVRKQIKIGNRIRSFFYDPVIANVNPNLKIIVSDTNYTTLMASESFSTWQPYLVKASDWEYVHHYELSAYATSADVATAISTATSGLVDQTELNSAISTATSGLATQTALTTAISAVEAEIPEVVSPYTSNSSGKAADAQDTGNALKTKATSFQPYRISNCVIQDNYWHNIRMFLDETNEIGIVFDGTGFIAFGWPDDTVQYDTTYDSFDDILTVTKNGTDYSYSVYYSVVATLKDIPRGETWNFTLEDGTTLTKSVAVY